MVRRVIYSVLKNKSKLPPCLVVEWGPEGEKITFLRGSQFFKAEETFASFPLLVFDILPLDAEQLGLHFRWEDMTCVNSFPHFLSAISGASGCHHTQGHWVRATCKASHHQESRLSFQYPSWLQIWHPGGRKPCDPTKSIQKHRPALEKTRRFCLEHRHVMST